MFGATQDEVRPGQRWTCVAPLGSGVSAEVDQVAADDGARTLKTLTVRTSLAACSLKL